MFLDQGKAVFFGGRRIWLDCWPSKFWCGPAVSDFGLGSDLASRPRTLENALYLFVLMAPAVGVAAAGAFSRRTAPNQPPAPTAIRIAIAMTNPSGGAIRKTSDRKGMVRVPTRMAAAIADTIQKTLCRGSKRRVEESEASARASARLPTTSTMNPAARTLEIRLTQGGPEDSTGASKGQKRLALFTSQLSRDRSRSYQKEGSSSRAHASKTNGRIRTHW